MPFKFNLPSGIFQFLLLLSLFLANSTVSYGQDPEELRLKDFRPVSIYQIPITKVEKAKFPAMDFHSHDFAKSDADVKNWIKTMNEAGIAKSMILTYSTGKRFDSIVEKYAPYNDKFEVWCGFDYTGNDQSGWAKRAVAELERCHKKGAIGVGELGDKGLGELYSRPTPGYGIHIDDPKMKPLIEKCGELKMPISIHISEDAWMYEKPDLHNDGLMNAAEWNVDQSKPGLIGHDALLATLEHAVRDNPKTTFIACHLANRCADLNTLGKLLDKYPNLYADIAARYGEIAPIPRFVHDFLERYSDRIVYGTDMGPEKDMYETTFRILESSDEHFYEIERFGYHWPLNGLYLTDATLEKIYNKNGKKILGR